MRSQIILQSMLENGFLSRTDHNALDYINWTVRAAKSLEEKLQDVRKPDTVAELVAAMFDAGFCTREKNADPAEWILFAEAAIAELATIK